MVPSNGYETMSLSSNTRPEKRRYTFDRQTIFICPPALVVNVLVPCRIHGRERGKHIIPCTFRALRSICMYRLECFWTEEGNLVWTWTQLEPIEVMERNQSAYQYEQYPRTSDAYLPAVGIALHRAHDTGAIVSRLWPTTGRGSF